MDLFYASIRLLTLPICYQVTCSEDLIRYCEQGNRIKLLSNTGGVPDEVKKSTIFTITIEQSPATGGNNSKGTRSSFSFVTLCDSKHTSKSEDSPHVSSALNSLAQVVTALTSKGSEVPYRDSSLTRLLENLFGGNAYAAVVGVVSPVDNDYEVRF